MDWKKYIASDPAILGGKPHIVGTRLSVDFILALMANGWTVEQVLSNYPTLSREHLRAVFAFAAEALRDEALIYLE